MALKAIAPPQGRRLTKKLLLIMNLTAILLFCGSLTLSAAGFSQKVTLSAKNAKLEKVFKEIKKQTGFGFLYTYELLDKAAPVTLFVKDAELPDVLQQIFDNQPLTWNIMEKTVVVKARMSSKETNDISDIASIDIKGRITNESGDAVVGASVLVKGTNNGTTTNSNGEFSLTGVDSKAFLILSGTNIETVEIAVENRTLLLLTTKIKVSPLDEVQIIAYGQTSRRFATGNTSTVKAEDIEKQPVNNPLLALSGRVPGLQITQQNGLPGGAIKVRVQGQNSITNGNAPLLLVDGIPFSYDVPGGTFGPIGNSGERTISTFSTGSGNALAYINPADIESIDVLKDADATSIYGSRAANGAILITTKKGKLGKTNINIDLQKGWGKVTQTPEMMNRRQYLDMRYEAFNNDGVIPSSDPFAVGVEVYAPDLTTWDTTRETNWVKELIGGTAQFTNLNASISGGTSTVQYLIGGTYRQETTVFPGAFKDDRQSAFFNLNNNGTNQKFRFQLSSSYLKDNNKLPGVDLTMPALIMEPVAPSIYTSEGNLNWEPNSIGGSTWDNPLATYLYNKYSAATNNLISSVNLSYSIFSNLEARLLAGYSNLQTDQSVIKSSLASRPEYFVPASSIFQNASTATWSLQPQIRWFKTLKNTQFEILVGSDWQETIKRALYTNVIGFASELLLNNPGAGGSQTSSLEQSLYRYNAFWGRINYTLKKRYIFNISSRRDGTSRFGPANRFHNFGSVGTAWIASDEPWMRNFQILSFLKFKGSYGTTGSDQIGDYAFQDLYGVSSSGILYQGVVNVTPRSIFNPYLAWEETKKLNIGLDLGFLKDRILIGVNYASNRSSNQLLSYKLPTMTGFGGVNTNFPATVQNITWEISLNTTNIKTKKLLWTTSINITAPKNKLLRFDSLSKSTYASTYVVGQPLAIIKAFHSLGVDPTTGIYMFIDHEGKPTETPDYYQDRTILLTPFQKFYGGFQNSVTYRGIRVDFLFSFVKQRSSNGSLFSNGLGNQPGLFSPYGSSGNQPVSVLNRWQKPGDMALTQRYSTGYNYSLNLANQNMSDAGYEDASYIRLKNIAVSWEVPSRLLRSLLFSKLRVYAEGQNLLTFTNYKGLDPETQSFWALPPLRVFVVGLNIGL
ncbi:MAG: SusC/RagA family TonB-linked outer membrane protein [Agriterribacter sp.]